MRKFRLDRDTEGRPVLYIHRRGTALLHSPIYNKGTGFSKEERQLFGLEGLLPTAIASIEEQAERVYANVTRSRDPLDRFIALSSLHDRNEHLFFYLLNQHLEEFLPIVYTPTVGRACQEYSHIYRRGRGMWLTPDHRGRLAEVLSSVPFENVRLIVVTDNERILGLGDQGAGGMGIPIGKLALYTAGAGIHPTLTLPISLDVGTDNVDLLEDPLYVGYRRTRLRGAEYDDFVEEFVDAVKVTFPRALLQWEDFKKSNAIRLLDRYRMRLCCFNDDIQGTAAVTVAGVLAAARVTGVPLERQRIVLAGSGAAGLGIARQLKSAMQALGVTPDALARSIAMTDSQGLLVESRDIREAYKREWAWPNDLAKSLELSGGADLERVVRAFRPTTLIGTSGQPGLFTQPIVEAMAQACDRPAVFPLSNPTSKSEATAEQLLQWSKGKALVATGSPFDPVTVGGRTVHIGQCNNAFIFPGIGLGVLVSEASHVTDPMFHAAARRLAEMVTEDDLQQGRLLPSVSRLREVARAIAIDVVRVARDTEMGRRIDGFDIPAAVDAMIWQPAYPRYIPLDD